MTTKFSGPDNPSVIKLEDKIAELDTLVAYLYNTFGAMTPYRRFILLMGVRDDLLEQLDGSVNEISALLDEIQVSTDYMDLFIRDLLLIREVSDWMSEPEDKS